MSFSVAARSSPLSRAQVREVLALLREQTPDAAFDVHYVETSGDLDQKTSLRGLDKTDFFTREVDALVLAGTCQLAVHSAKDLPASIPSGLKLIALTHGQDPADVLVLRENETLASLPAGAVIATSSERREESVKKLRNDLIFNDLRGTIETRLANLYTREADGVVVAEAALIRLGLAHLNRIRLADDTVPMQGQLAILAHENDRALENLFRPLDSRQVPFKTVYLGIDPPDRKECIHYPIIRTVPFPNSQEDIMQGFQNLSAYTHLLFTSKNGVRYFAQKLNEFGYSKQDAHGKEIVAVGKKTAALLSEYGFEVSLIAEEETGEGVIKKMEVLELKGAHFFWPHSALARPVIADYFHRRGVPLQECHLYTVEPSFPDKPLPLADVHEIIFTSPSTLDAYLALFGPLPTHKRIKGIGPVTARYIHNHFGDYTCQFLP